MFWRETSRLAITGEAGGPTFGICDLRFAICDCRNAQSKIENWKLKIPSRWRDRAGISPAYPFTRFLWKTAPRSFECKELVPNSPLRLSQSQTRWWCIMPARFQISRKLSQPKGTIYGCTTTDRNIPDQQPSQSLFARCDPGGAFGWCACFQGPKCRKAVCPYS